jgi:hypothetical protein
MSRLTSSTKFGQIERLRTPPNILGYSANNSIQTDVDSQESLDNLVKVVSKDHDSLDMLFPNGSVP